jgi:hypothetical protein
VHLLILAIGALIHIPLIFADDLVLFAIYHAIYIGVVTVYVGRFLWMEAQYRRWKKDYLRALARLEGEGHPQGWWLRRNAFALGKSAGRTLLLHGQSRDLCESDDWRRVPSAGQRFGLLSIEAQA